MPGWLGASIAAVWVALAVFWMATYSGPYRWLSELQLRHWGEFSLGISLAIPAALGAAATLFAAAALTGTRVERVSDAPEGASAVPGVYRHPLLPLALLGGGLLWGASEHRKAASMGELRPAAAGDFLPGRTTAPAAYVEVTGVPDDRAVQDDDDLLFALRPAGSEASAVAPVVVSVPERDVASLVARNDADGTVTVRGVATPGLRAAPKRYLAAQGVALPERPWTLRAGRTPRDVHRAGSIVLWLAAAGAVAAWVFQWIEKRRPAA